MEPIGFQMALQDSSLANGLLDEQVKEWNSHLSDAINVIAPRHPLCPRARPALWYSLELQQMKQNLK